jgi:NTP pyrophosphatase (non-canonical NTP hydrolase)
MGYMTDGLTLNTLRGANAARLPKFKNAKGELSHPTVDGHNDNWSLCDWATAVTGELGEAANVIKKIRRGDFTLEEKRVELGKELADVLCYLDLLALAAGIDLGRVTIDKFNEVSNRIDCPIKIRLDGSDWCITRADG